jgi:tetratricopeptide (TPR) repeat protein
MIFSRSRFMVQQMSSACWLSALVVFLLLCITVFRNAVWQDDVALWKDAAEKSPSSARVLYNLGNAERASGRMREAETAYRAAGELCGGRYDCADIYANLGLVYESLGLIDNALHVYLNALSINKNHADTLNNLGRLMQRTGDAAGAERVYRHFIEAHPGDRKAYYGLGKSLAAQGKDAEAARAFAFGRELYLYKAR